MPIHDMRCTNQQCGRFCRDFSVTDTMIVLCPLCGSPMQWVPSKIAVTGIRPRSDQATYNPDFNDREEHTRGLRAFMAREEAAGRLSPETLKLDPADLWCPDGRLHSAEQEMADDECRSHEADVKTELQECEKGLANVDRAINNLSPETVKEQMRTFHAMQRPKREDLAGVDIKHVGEV